MRIIQFRSAVPQVAFGLQQLMLTQINIWSSLAAISEADPLYVSEPFGLDQWKQHPLNPNLYWVDWDSIYDNLGDRGRVIADQFLTPGPMSGILLGKPLISSFPDTFLELVEVDRDTTDYIVRPQE